MIDKYVRSITVTIKFKASSDRLIAKKKYTHTNWGTKLEQVTRHFLLAGAPGWWELSNDYTLREVFLLEEFLILSQTCMHKYQYFVEDLHLCSLLNLIMKYRHKTGSASLILSPISTFLSIDNQDYPAGTDVGSSAPLPLKHLYWRPTGV